MPERVTGQNGGFLNTYQRELKIVGAGVLGMLFLLGWKWYDDYLYSQAEEAAGRPPTISYEGALASVGEYERKVLEEARICHSVVPNCPVEAYEVVGRRLVTDKPRTWVDDLRLLLSAIPGSAVLLGIAEIMRRNTIERRRTDPNFSPPTIF